MILPEFRQIDLIEKFIIFCIVATMFLFCFWQEWDEKKRGISSQLKKNNPPGGELRPMFFDKIKKLTKIKE